MREQINKIMIELLIEKLPGAPGRDRARRGSSEAAIKKVLHNRYRNYVRRAREKGMVIEFDEAEFRTLVWGSVCTYCGDVELMMTLDRIDNSKGYTFDNITPACFFCNTSKGVLSVDEFQRKCKQVADLESKHPDPTGQEGTGFSGED